MSSRDKEHGTFDSTEPSDCNHPRIKAVQYIRMSTDHQKYSTENQSDIIKTYAAEHGMTIIRTYADRGKSGLSIAGRDALRSLITIVESGSADFKAILVYDISRWGRFQDTDESAYYEYICKRAGIRIHYCAEQFENDGSISSTIIKSVKRAMASEYSRELSTKVFQGQCRLIELGFRQGGAPGYGLRRMLIDEQGKHKGVLNRGEHKSLQTDRIILVPGPPEEIKVVQEIYKIFTKEGKLESEIAEMLNRRGLRTDLNRKWTRGTVHQVLANEKYIGNNVFNRQSFKLKQDRVRNPEDQWIRAEGVFESIIDFESFYFAKGVISSRSLRLSDDEMLERLKAVLSKHKKISGLIIDESEGIPSSSAYRTRFGSLIRCYRLVGYTPERDYQYIEVNRHLRELYPRMMDDMIRRLEDVPASIDRDLITDILTINNEFTISVVISRCMFTSAGSSRWLIRLDTGLAPDISIVIRMDTANENMKDYFILPRIDIAAEKIRMAEFNGFSLDTYRFDTLDIFYGMAERAKVALL